MNPLLQLTLLLSLLLTFFTCSPTEASTYQYLGSDFDKLILKYQAIKLTESKYCPRIRELAEDAYSQAMHYHMALASVESNGGGAGKCLKLNQKPKMIDIIGRVCCMINHEFSQDERIGLIFIGTLYALSIYAFVCLFSYIGEITWELILSCFAPRPPPSTRTQRRSTQLRANIRLQQLSAAASAAATNVKLYPDVGKMTPPPAYTSPV